LTQPTPDIAQESVLETKPYRPSGAVTLSERKQGEQLVGERIYLHVDHVADHPEVPAEEPLEVLRFRKPRGGRKPYGPLYLVRLPDGSVYGLEPQFVSQYTPAEQRAIKAAPRGLI
jgi:hypothetical protein